MMRPFGGKKYTSHSDEELMELIGRGETSAFDELYARYSGRLLMYFYRMLSNDEERAHDILHDIFLKIIERPQLFDRGRRFSTWIFSVAHNTCKNEYRWRQVRQPAEMELDEIESGIEGGDERFDRERFAAMLDLELGMLSEEHRSTFILRYQEDLSIAEISRILECPEGTVKSRLFYAIRKLADRLKMYNPHCEDHYGCTS
jgi:RNA polymerase sigma-70 factor (ECF subfamily)